MKASVMLEKSSAYEIIPLPKDGRKLLVLYKSTETGDPFVVVAGCFLRETGSYEEQVLAEIETVKVADYEPLKKELRERIGKEGGKRVPITFW